MLAALIALAEEGRIELPRKLDRSAHPPLPAYVTRPAAERPLAPPDKAIVWHADLDWAARRDDNGELGSADRRLLAAINAWLPRRRGVRVPMRERSLEIFDDEKVLENIAIGPLFGRERLSFDLLETLPCWPPVEQLNLGSGPWLIIENYTTYYSISSRAKELGFAGRVVWGSGNQVGTRLSALAAATDPPPACWYFGDVDAGGFRAAKLAVTRAAELGLPMMSPALGLYDLALRHGTTRRAGHGQVPGELVTWTRTWLGDLVGEPASDIVKRGLRIVQEYVGSELLATTGLSDWFALRAPDHG